MKLHFVCTGNIYRSRMAEAYFNSLRSEEWSATSSGIAASKNSNGSTWWGTKVVLENHGIGSYMSVTWKETTKKILEESNCIVFMQPAHYQFCKQRFAPVLQRFVIWDIEDFNPAKYNRQEILSISEATFQNITQHINTLLPSFVVH